MKDLNQVPWYKSSIVWMLITVPGSAVIMGIIILVLAISSSDGLVADDYYKLGKEINRSLMRDKRANEYSLYAQLYWTNNQTVNIKLQANDTSAYHGREIDLYLRHPTREGFDRHIKLKAISGDGLYEAKVAKNLKQGRWRVEVSTNIWRLIGRLQWPTQQNLLLSSIPLLAKDKY